MIKLSLSLIAMIFLCFGAIASEPVTIITNDAVIVNEGEYFQSDNADYAEIDGLPQLDFTTYTPQLFWMFLFFALLYVIFAKKTLPEISGTIENRKNHIQSDLEGAEKLTIEADKVHNAYQEKLGVSQNTANKTIQDMESKIKAKAEKAMNDFRKRSEDEVNSAEERIIAAKKTAMNDMNKIVTEVTAQAVEKILGQSPDVSLVKDTVEMLNETPKAKAA